MSSIYIVRGYGSIFIEVIGNQSTFTINYIEDYVILLEAFSAARAAGATNGVLFTGEVNDDRIAESLIRAAQSRSTFAGGKVARLPDSANGRPQFKIEFEYLPASSE